MTFSQLNLYIHTSTLEKLHSSAISCLLKILYDQKQWYFCNECFDIVRWIYNILVTKFEYGSNVTNDFSKSIFIVYLRANFTVTLNHVLCNTHHICIKLIPDISYSRVCMCVGIVFFKLLWCWHFSKITAT